MRFKWLLSVVFLACMPSPAAAAASGAPGSIDRSFGRGGVATLHDPYLSLLPSFLAEQPDGGILVGARASVPGSLAGPGFVVTRYDRRGRRDPSFGTNGRVEAELSSGVAAALPGGEFFVAGATPTDVGSEIGLRRYTSRGRPAAGFAGAAKPVTTLPYRVYDSPFAVAGDAEGRMLVAPNDGSVYRLTANGAPDPSFGTQGRATPSLSATSIRVYALAVQRDGRIVLAGERRALFGTGAATLLIARLLPDGSLDRAFGGPGAGRVVDNDTVHWREAHAVAVDRAGGIFAGGYSAPLTAGSTETALWRFPADGVGGRLTFTPNLTTAQAATGIALDRAGGILVLAGGTFTNEAATLLFRLRPDGRVDRGFARRGHATWKDRNPAAGPLVLRDGRIVMALGEQLGEPSDEEGPPPDVALVRIARLWGGYDKVAPRIGVRLSCAGAKTVARLRVRDRSRISKLSVWIAGHRIWPVSHTRVRLVLRRTGNLRVVAVDQADNRAARTVRVPGCVSG